MKFYTNGFPTNLTDVQFVFQNELAANIGAWSSVGVAESASAAGTYLVDVAVPVGAFRIAWRVASDTFVKSFEDIKTPVNLQPVLDAITVQNGIGFDTTTDSLRKIREGLADAGGYLESDRARDKAISTQTAYVSNRLTFIPEGVQITFTGVPTATRRPVGGVTTDAFGEIQGNVSFYAQVISGGPSGHLASHRHSVTSETDGTFEFQGFQGATYQLVGIDGNKLIGTTFVVPTTGSGGYTVPFAVR